MMEVGHTSRGTAERMPGSALMLLAQRSHPLTTAHGAATAR